MSLEETLEHPMDLVTGQRLRPGKGPQDHGNPFPLLPTSVPAHADNLGLGH